MVLQVELADVLQEAAISTLPFQIIHLLSRHCTFVCNI